MAKPKLAWMVRAGNDNELAPYMDKTNAVAIGWHEMGDLSPLKSREQFKACYQQTYPDDSATRMSVNTGQVYRFAVEMKEGDHVLTYIKNSRELIIGLLEGPYEYNCKLFFEDYCHVRRVKWLKRVSRDAFSLSARNSMGSTLTVFQVSDHLEEILQIMGTYAETPAIVVQENAETPPFYEEVEAKANELIADLISRLDPYDFQDLVAAVLRAMNFRAVSVPPGRDRGVDIIAHPDPLGFERPHIKAQVKHRKDAASGPELRAFLGVLRSGDSGLYVSTGGFTADAKLEAERSREPITMLNRDGFIRLLLEHYETLAPEYQSKVPLRKVWVPTK